MNSAPADFKAVAAKRVWHVCFVCNELPPAPGGGIGAVVANLAQSFQEAGQRVTVVGCYERVYDWNLRGVEVRTIPTAARHRLPGWGPSTRTRLRQCLEAVHRDQRIDIIEWPSYQRLYVEPIAGTVDVVRIHNHIPARSGRGLGFPSYLQRAAYVQTLKKIPHWIGVSQWILDVSKRLVEAGDKETAVIHNPIDGDLFHPGTQSEREPVILFAGSLQESKGAFGLAAAARIFLEKLPTARLVYAGADVTGRGREKILQNCGPAVAGRVEFKGRLAQAELAALMRRCSVLAALGWEETFCNVWAEAMAAGLPVIAPAAGVGPEIVPANEAGLLVDPLNAAQIADAVVRLMQGAELRAQFGEAGRAIALARYSRPRCFRETLAFYEKCLAGARTSR